MNNKQQHTLKLLRSETEINREHCSRIRVDFICFCLYYGEMKNKEKGNFINEVCLWFDILPNADREHS